MSVVVMSHRRTMLARALHAHRSKDYSGAGLLQDFNARGFNPQLGSTSGADANDPMFHSAVGADGFLRMHGVDGTLVRRNDNTFSGKSAGSLRVIVRAQHATWRATQYLTGAASNMRLTTRLNSDGTVALFTSSATNGSVTATSTAAVPADALARLIRFTFDFDTTTCTFDTAPDVSDYASAVWTQLGNPVSFNPGALGNITILVIGEARTSPANAPWDGRIYGAWFFNNGALLCGANFANASLYNGARTGITDAVSGSWAIDRPATTTPRRPEVLFTGEAVLSYAVDDYDTLAHDARFDPGVADFTAAALLRKYGVTGDSQRVYGKRNAAAGWNINIDSAGAYRATLSDGTTTVSTDAISGTDGVAAVVVMTVDRSAQTLTLRLLDTTGAVVATSNAASISGVGSVSNSEPVRAGATSAGTLPLSAAIIGRDVYPGIAISRTADLARVVQEMLA